MAEPIVEIRDFLRTRLTDPAISRDIDNYVYTWFPRINLTADSFPLISVTQIGETANVFGLGSTVHWNSFQVQLDIYTKEDLVLLMGGINREGKEMVFYIAREVEEALRQYWIEDFANNDLFKLYRFTGKKPVVYDETKRLFRITLTLEVEMETKDGWI